MSTPEFGAFSSNITFGEKATEKPLTSAQIDALAQNSIGVPVDAVSRSIREQLSVCQQILDRKKVEYATDEDRLHNFRVAAAMTGETMAEALAGMMVKHTTSIYDLIRDSAKGMHIGLATWEEKITDHINYLLLLKAIVDENETGIESSPSVRAV